LRQLLRCAALGTPRATCTYIDLAYRPVIPCIVAGASSRRALPEAVMSKIWGPLVALAAWSGLGCTAEPEAPVATCPDGNTIGGVCAGVPSTPLCDGDTCGDPSCSAVVVVGSDAELTAALQSAAPGSCVALSPGAYQHALVPAGVKLLGKGADFVSVGQVELGVGSDSLVRGVTVSSDGITVSGTNGTVDAVRVTNAATDGITLAQGASATVSRSDVSGSTRYAASAFDVVSLEVADSILSGAKGPGLWAQCSAGCACTTPIDVTVRNTVIRDTKVVGLSLVGVAATLEDVEISNNTVDDQFQPGGGLAVSGCSTLTASGLSVHDNTNFGVLVDDSSASLQPSADGMGLTVSKNLRGIWAQYIGQSAQQSFTVDGATVSDNIGIGIGIDGGALNVSLTDCTVSNTAMVSLPALVHGVSAGAKDVGDGLNWLAVSHVTIDGLTVSNSARASVLIDGPVADGSSIAHVTLAGNDLALGIVQQNLPQDGTQPTVGEAAPPIQSTPSEQFPIAIGLGIPPEF
jgi:hypothetical protein